MTTKSKRPTYSLATTGGSTRSKDSYDHKRSNGSSHSNRRSRGSQHNNSHGEDWDPTDGNASLTYSAASSVHSGGSAAGESTDSSFADVMRVLDIQDSQELKDLIKKEGVSSVGELRSRRMGGGQSVASSLVYSTDGESHLEGSQMLQTITGQPSDAYGYDGAAYGGRKEESLPGDLGLMFAPAEPGVLNKKKKKGKGRPTPPSVHAPVVALTPPSKRHPSSYRDTSPSPSVDTPTKSPPTEHSTPPPHPRTKKYHVEHPDDEDEVWYAKWWMVCFPEAKNLMPKR